MTMSTTELRFLATEGSGEVSGLLTRPAEPWALLVLAHGAGADMRHRFMADVSAALGERGVAVLRYQFPYTEQGKRRPDPQPRLVATVRAAVAEGVRLAEGLPVLAGGKSLGGRMTSHAAADDGLPQAQGLVFFGFPLHPADDVGTKRAEHLPRVSQPLLFLQGTRDELAELPLIEQVLGQLQPRARLHVVDDADHSFAVRKTRGHDPAAVIPGLADATVAWAREVLAATADPR
jgi:predicted alpha/beta-hydrolase family hydrolase